MFNTFRRWIAKDIIKPLEDRVEQYEGDYRYWMDAAHHNYSRFGDFVTEMSKLGIRRMGDGDIQILDFDEEAKQGRLWDSMTPAQKNKCRKKWKENLAKSQKIT